MSSRIVRFVLSLLLAGLIAGIGTWALGLFWIAIGGGTMSVHGWIALSLGILGTVALAWGLMYLAFKSNSEGWDVRVDNTLDPGRDETKDR